MLQGLDSQYICKKNFDEANFREFFNYSKSFASSLNR